MNYLPLLCLLCCFPGIFAKCKLPQTKDDVDWDRVGGPWYLAVHTGDPGSTEDVSCGVLTTISTDSGFNMTVEDYVLGHTNPTQFTLQNIAMGEGIYQIDRQSELSMVLAHAVSPDGKLNLAALRNDMYEIETAGSFFTSDIDNYFLHVTCSPSDEYIVWGSTRNPYPTASDILPLLNAMAELNIGTKLYLSKCFEFGRPK